MVKREGMRTGPILAGACVLLIGICMLFMAGCQKQQDAENTKDPDALAQLGTILVAAREEGSGTRTVFAKKAGLLPRTESEKPDRTRKDACTANSTKEVITYVNSNQAAIGYASVGTENETGEVKTIKVDGVKADTENIKKDKYPLSRPFLLAYTGELDELETDFFDYVMGKGQKIVQKSYVAVEKESTFLSNNASGVITIHGSTSMEELINQLAEEYMTINPNAKIEVTASDSTSGLSDAMQGRCDLGMASRELKDYEQELMKYKVIAKDGIAIVVNPKNPLENITTKQLQKIYTGKIQEWKELQ